MFVQLCIVDATPTVIGVVGTLVTGLLTLLTIFARGIISEHKGLVGALKENTDVQRELVAKLDVMIVRQDERDKSLHKAVERTENAAHDAARDAATAARVATEAFRRLGKSS